MPNSRIHQEHLPLGAERDRCTRSRAAGKQRPNDHDEARVAPLQDASGDQSRDPAGQKEQSHRRRNRRHGKPALRRERMHVDGQVVEAEPRRHRENGEQIARQYPAIAFRSHADLPVQERSRLDGAGGGNRTLVCSLGSCRSAIELHPQRAADYGMESLVGAFGSRRRWVCVASDPLEPSLGARPAPSMAPDGPQQHTPTSASVASPSLDRVSCVNARKARVHPHQERRRRVRMWKVTGDRCAGASLAQGWPRKERPRMARASPGAPITRHQPDLNGTHSTNSDRVGSV